MNRGASVAAKRDVGQRVLSAQLHKGAVMNRYTLITVASLLLAPVAFAGRQLCARVSMPTPGKNLSGQDLRQRNLAGASLRHANLSGADLRGVDLTGAKLYRANLAGANLAGAILDDANLRYADLGCADLTGASIKGTELEGDNLDGAVVEGVDAIDAYDFPSPIAGPEVCVGEPPK
jgi:uncharacterized protein YjbI with pentapeptide repeats